MSGGLVFFAGQCPWAVIGRVWQNVRAAVAIGAVYTNEANKRLFYVACSRATQRLALFVQGNEEKILQIADSINTRSKFAPKGRVAMKTQAKILVIE